MSKKIEEYVKENKKAFDIGVPSEDLWCKIEVGLNERESGKKKKRLGLPFWLGAAASLLAGMTFVFMYTYFNRKKEVEIADVNPGYAKKEMKFASLIEEKKDSLQIYAKDNPDLYNKFSNDLLELNKDYINLKMELQHSPDQKLVVQAMVRNLEIQLQIINQQLSVISQVNAYKKENQI
ncbi:hypothetical protein [Pedobacter frigoris]|uniref:Anti-sigma factor n=1 Tax=Pedobacter frigoris TaxID=2571272 RepID=A0A4U1CDH7_9SPHI|nr:hypothetical protein [Pedobacter frigoris]TKC05014.1 hypothetical protein FA047_14695 [Pedobacter frigoris]